MAEHPMVHAWEQVVWPVCIREDASGEQQRSASGESMPDESVPDESMPGKPAQRRPNGRGPALIYCRGGIGRVGAVRLEWIEGFTRLGYVVFAPCYRGSEGGEGRDEFGGADVDDVIAAYNLLASLPMVNTQNIRMMGFSRGSIDACMATVRLNRDGQKVAQLILWGGVSDVAQTYEQRVDLRRMLRRVLGGTPRKKPAEYDRRSVLRSLPDVRCPVLLVHGTEDVQVDFSHARQAATRLKESKCLYECHFYEGLGHHLPLQIHRAVVDRMLCWNPPIKSKSDR